MGNIVASKDWGSTTTWLAILNLIASTFLLFNGNITATDWTIINGIGTGGVAGKGMVKAVKTNGAVQPPKP